MAEYRIRAGDTLSSIARQHKVGVNELAQANHIRNPNKILVGDTLKLPGGRPPSSGNTTATPSLHRPRPAPINTADVFEAPPSRPATSTGPFRDEKTGRTFKNSNGYPLYAQGDAEWGAKQIGTKTGPRDNMTNFGCAVSSVAMAISGITGRTVTPGELDAHMKQKGAMTNNAIGTWGAAGSVDGLGVQVTRQPAGKFGADRIDQELAQGKPVAVGVDYKTGSGANRRLVHDGKTDHWILITGKSADGKSYLANDPATGNAITLRKEGNRLVANALDKDYQTTGDATTFGQGPGKTAPIPAPVSQRPLAPVANSGVQTLAGVGANGFKSVEPADFRHGGVQSQAAIVIGTAEGNRTPKGGVRDSYHGHSDPANNKTNIGSFSVQGSKAARANGDPARADALQLAELASVTPKFETAARAAGLDPRNSLLLASYYDMQTQSPATAAAFLRELPGLASKGVTAETLIQARVHAFQNNGKTGGWHDTPGKVEPDARRRTLALVDALRAQGFAN
ncbi:Peptidase_C39 like family protein [Stigmatella aurantiaca]|uniref:Peptidase_C39 like family protein n=1 Tax=Stigmatella aurantiaca TaxID=41 RepID=A0A1H8B889_STIAU|nr:LysM peptidoglycan-binding domain-containing protein [Stigmatella aurantiaca]SEM78324.1 Peptidase_C39 like family protein [Stigmatella aurantiaca]